MMYTYECRACGKRATVHNKHNFLHRKKCPTPAPHMLTRIYKAPLVIFKGDGYTKAAQKDRKR